MQQNQVQPKPKPSELVISPLAEYANQAWQQHAKPFTCTLIVAVYNKVDFFKLVFASIEQQSLKNFELLICDDGSSPESIQAFKQLMDQSQIPCCHLWHEDKGVRKTQMLNWGVIRAQSDYLVTIDGDCVLHPDFLRDHSENRKAKAVLAGRRMDLTPWLTRGMSLEKIRTQFIPRNYWWIVFAIAYMKDNNGMKGLRLPWAWLRNVMNRKPREIVGCNFSIHRQDLIDINGYDNRYCHGLGTGEDSDIDFRLRKNGVAILPFCHLGIQYHLYHPLRDRGTENEEIFASVRAAGAVQTSVGIRQMTSL